MNMSSIKHFEMGGSRLFGAFCNALYSKFPKKYLSSLVQMWYPWLCHEFVDRVCHQNKNSCISECNQTSVANVIVEVGACLCKSFPMLISRFVCPRPVVYLCIVTVHQVLLV